MNFVPINFSDPDFNPDYVADCQLIIVIDSLTFNYAVHDSDKNHLIRVSTGHPLEELFSLQYKQLFSAKNYQKIVVAAETNSFCLVPDAFFTPENLVDFAAFLSVKEADLILTDQLSNGNNTVIFTLPETIVKEVKSQFPAAKIQFAAKSWIKTVFDAKFTSQILYLFIEEKTLKILFPDQENIRFYNQFDCTAINEILYFTALVANQLNLKPEETNLILSGKVEGDGEIMLRLRAFFKEVSLFSTSDFQQKEVLPQHQIVSFLALS